MINILIKGYKGGEYLLLNKNELKYYFFSDGASEPTNPGPSAFAFVELSDYHDKRELYSFYQYIGFTTNNVAELKGINAIFEHIINNKEKYLSDPTSEIYIYSDSRYALNCISLWYPIWVKTNKLSSKKNLDLIRPMYDTYLHISSKVRLRMEWVKGHNGHWGNERADHLCNKALEESNNIEPVIRYNQLIDEAHIISIRLATIKSELSELHAKLTGREIHHLDLSIAVTNKKHL